MSYSVAGDSTATGVTGSTFVTGVTVTTEDLTSATTAKAGCCDFVWACMLNDDYDSDKDVIETHKLEKNRPSRRRNTEVIRDAEGGKVADFEEDDPWSFVDQSDGDKSDGDKSDGDVGDSIIRRLKSKEAKEEYLEYRKWKQKKEMQLKKSNSRSRINDEGGSEYRRSPSASETRHDGSSIDTRESGQTGHSRSGESGYSRHDTGKSECSSRSRRKRWPRLRSRSEHSRERRSLGRIKTQEKEEVSSRRDEHGRHSSRSRGNKDRRGPPPRPTKDSGYQDKKGRRAEVPLNKSEGHAGGLDEVHPAVGDPTRTRRGSGGNIQQTQENGAKVKSILVNGRNGYEPESRHQESSAPPISGSKQNDQMAHGEPSRIAPQSNNGVQTIKSPQTRHRQVDNISTQGLSNPGAQDVNKLAVNSTAHEQQGFERAQEFSRENDTTSSPQLLDRSAPEANFPQMCTDNEKPNDGPGKEDNACTDSVSNRDEVNPPRREQSATAHTDREGTDNFPASPSLKHPRSSEDSAALQSTLQTAKAKVPFHQAAIGGVFHSRPSETQSVKSSQSDTTAWSMGAIFHSLSAEPQTVPNNVLVTQDDASSNNGVSPSKIIAGEPGQDGASMVVAETASTYARRKRPMLPAFPNTAALRDAGSVASLDPIPVSARPRTRTLRNVRPSSVC
jgi:hypothetical protein